VHTDQLATRQTLATQFKLTTTGITHSKPRPVLYCRVLPPREFNGMILEPSPIDSESFTTTAAIV